MTKPELQPFAPLELTARGQLVGALAARRHALAWTGADLDVRAGFPERYSAKLERPETPQGRLGFQFDAPTEVTPTGTIRCSGLGEVWLIALGLRLVLVDAATAVAIGAAPAPLPEAGHRAGWTGGNAGPGHAAKRKERGRQCAMPVEAFAAAERTAVAGQSFRATVTAHPFVEARPDLRAEAERIEADLAALADRIREAA